MVVVRPGAPVAVLSQDLDAEARCDEPRGGLSQLHMEVLPQAAEPEVDRFAALPSVSISASVGVGVQAGVLR